MILFLLNLKYPEDLGILAVRIFIKVDFPAEFGPIIVSIYLFYIVNEIFDNAIF